MKVNIILLIKVSKLVYYFPIIMKSLDYQSNEIIMETNIGIQLYLRKYL